MLLKHSVAKIGFDVCKYTRREHELYANKSQLVTKSKWKLGEVGVSYERRRLDVAVQCVGKSILSNEGRKCGNAITFMLSHIFTAVGNLTICQSSFICV